MPGPATDKGEWKPQSSPGTIRGFGRLVRLTKENGPLSMLLIYSISIELRLTKENGQICEQVTTSELADLLEGLKRSNKEMEMEANQRIRAKHGDKFGRRGSMLGSVMEDPNRPDWEKVKRETKEALATGVTGAWGFAKMQNYVHVMMFDVSLCWSIWVNLSFQISNPLHVSMIRFHVLTC